MSTLPEVGDWVRLDTTDCDLTCPNGHPEFHRAWNNAICKVVGGGDPGEWPESERQNLDSAFEAGCQECASGLGMLDIWAAKHVICLEAEGFEFWASLPEIVEIYGQSFDPIIQVAMAADGEPRAVAAVEGCAECKGKPYGT